MIRKSLFLFSFIVLISTASFSQSNFPKLNPDEITGLKILHEQYYDGNSLWGFMDGGADIYLEYGFNKLLDQEVEIDKIKYKTDIYKMTDPVSAFGIFSIYSYKCLKLDSVLKYSCISKYQYQFVSGNYYVSIINDKGDDATVKTASIIAKIINSKINEPSFTLPAVFESELFKSHKREVKFFKGTLGVQNGIPEWEELFSNITGYSFFSLDYPLAKSSVKIAIITFSATEEFVKFVKYNKTYKPPLKEYVANKTGKKNLGVIKISNTSLLFIESEKGDFEAESLIKKITEFVKANY